ncbi:hypothetical protein O181_034834 [Austropuccinia psidii MF-1]|uniref:Reverse transcriptase Ty1/copia-type domain-containing protein n=1 Tax=Austropuccinia psidii MF-1 TaxID=1389203 RepID=A0A9Q3D1L2_9BASI|nr:hypothetical protein [Austropuccinia psidii MF-1]
MVSHYRLKPINDNEGSPNLDYRKAIGVLNYLVSCSRPDLAYFTSALSQFLEKPSEDHVIAFKKILQYLQGTKSKRLVLGGDKPVEYVQGSSDSDWGNNHDG